MSFPSSRRSLCLLVFAVMGLLSVPGANAQTVPLIGDLNADGKITIGDVIQSLQIAIGLRDPLIQNDVNFDSKQNVQDTVLLLQVVVGSATLNPPILTVLSSSSPISGESDVAVTRETVLHFSRPLSATATVTSDTIYAEYGGAKVSALLHVSPERDKVTLFYQNDLPANARVKVTVVGDKLLDENNRAVDGDSNGYAGGNATLFFNTLTLTTLPKTTVSGRVFASQLQPGSQESVNVPLAGVSVTVDGKEETLNAVTDANGNFTLDPAPVGEFFVHVDGRTASVSMPAGAYYPYVGKKWHGESGQAVNIDEIYLPLIPTGTLQAVSQSDPTTIKMADETLKEHPEFSSVSLTVPPDSLYSEDGTRGGMVGIAPVPPDRLPQKLPDGLEFPVVITVQTNGPTDFDKPVPVCFPNLPTAANNNQPLPPGAQNWLYSFDHDVGKWIPIGPMTVGQDGKLICTDSGVGIVKPGWHGSGPRPFQPKPPDPCPPGTCCIPPPPNDGPGPPLGGSSGNMNVSVGGITLLSEPTGTLGGSVPLGASPGGAVLQGAKYDKCVTRCAEDAAVCSTACSASAAAAIYFCPDTGPAFFHCAGAVAAAYAICQAACGTVYALCAHRCSDDCGNSLTVPSGPRPLQGGPPGNNDPVLAQVDALMGQIMDLVYPYAIAGKELPADVKAQVAALRAQADTIAGGSAYNYSRNALLQSEQSLIATEAQEGPDPGNAPDYPVPYMALAVRQGGDPVFIRGLTEGNGQYSLFVPRDGQLVSVQFYDPRTKSYGKIVPRVTPSEQYDLPHFTLTPVDASYKDFDNDGLSDVAEAVLGTDPANPDSDGDGVKDGPEVDQGTNPLDGRPAQTGILATSDTDGSATDVAALNDLVAVADGNAGVTIFNIYSGMNPTRVAQVDTAGFAGGIAMEGSNVAVADGPGGLALLSLADPTAVGSTLHSVPAAELFGQGVSVAMAGGTAYVGLDSGSVVSVDPVDGQLLDRVALGGGAVDDLAFAGDVLYALTDQKLFAISLADNHMTVAGSVAAPGEVPIARKRLFVGGGIAYATQMRGYYVYDLTDPLNPVQIAGGDTTEVGWKQLIANGSGLGIATDGLNRSDDGPHNVSLYDLSDPKQFNRFITTFETPGIATSVAIYNGLAYVADRDSGLQVVNYLAYDNKNVPPAIKLSTSFPATGAEEDSLGSVTATVSDDVQVRNVEFYVNGVKVDTDGNFPFEYRFRVPPLSAGASFKLRARASDTGGNLTWSDELTIPIVKDSHPPKVLRYTPHGFVLGSSATVTATAIFSEPINTATLTPQTFAVYGVGPDGAPGTADDAFVSGGALSFDAARNMATLHFAQALPAGSYRAVISAPLADLSGNAIAQQFSWNFLIASASPAANGTGVSGAYYDWNSAGPNLRTELFKPENYRFTRTDPTIDFNFPSPKGPGVSDDYFGVRWTGQVTPKFSEDYVFHVDTDDGVRLWISDDAIDPDRDPAIIDNWGGSANASSAPITLQAGKKYNLLMEYFDYSGPEGAHLSWSSPQTPVEIIPQSQLTPVPVTPPTVLNVTPRGFAADPASSISATFSGLVDLGPISNSTFHVTAAGPDDTFNTADDTPVPGGNMSYDPATSTATLALQQALTPGLYRASLPLPLADQVSRMPTFEWIFRIPTGDNRDGTGLWGDYYLWPTGDPSDRTVLFTPNTIRASRIDPQVNFDYGHPPGADVSSTNIGIRWHGTVRPEFTGLYTFTTSTDDGSRLWVSDKPIDPTADLPIINDWTFHGQAERASKPIELEGGKQYYVLMEFLQGGGPDAAQLLWDNPVFAPKQPIPQLDLFPPLRVLSVTPAGNTQVDSAPSVLVKLNGALDPASLSANSISLLAGGPDGIAATADDVAVIGAGAYDPIGRTLSLSFSPPLVGGLYHGTVATTIADALHTPLEFPFEWSFFAGAGEDGIIKGTGVKGEYYTFSGDVSDRTTVFTPDNLKATRVDPNINFDYNHQPGSDVSTSNLAARWSGTIMPPYSEDYTFYSSTDDGARLWISDKPIDPATTPPLIDHWVGQGQTETASRSIRLEGGRRYYLLMEFFQGGGPAAAQLSWSGSISVPKAIIPQEVLFPAN